MQLNIIKKREKGDIKYLLLLLFCCLVAYWPLTFHIYSLKNDALVVFLPIRYQISEAIKTGNFPLWTPYLNLGYPLHADMQAGVWNPFVWLFSLFGPYTLYTLQNETLLYVYLAGVCMFYLLKQFVTKKNIAFFGAVAYMLCGYISDSAQFLLWIASAAFLPAVFLFYYRLLIYQRWHDAIGVALFLYLLFTCGYPADFILSAYLLLAFLLFYYLHHKESRTKENFIKHLQLHFVACVCFLILSLPALLSYIEVLHYIERGSGISYEAAMSNPLHPLLLLSYVTPLAVWKAPYVAITDPLERNCYIGIITFLLLLTGLILKTENRVLKFAKLAWLISLVFSLGELGGLRPVTYYTLPLMDTFRHPANAKVFTLFFGCMIAAFTLLSVSSYNIKFRNRKIAYIMIILSLVVLSIWAFSGEAILSKGLFQQLQAANMDATILKSLLNKITFSDLLLINIVIQIPFIILCYFLYVKRVSVRWLIALGITNCVLHTMLFQPFTVVNKDRADVIQAILQRVQQPGYPLPDLSTSIKINSRDGNQYFDAIAAANMYNKKIGRTDFHIIPSNLHTQNKFWHNKTLRSTFVEYPLFYRADTAINSSLLSYENASTKSRIVVTENNELRLFINNLTAATYTASTKQFSPNRWDIEVNSTQPGFYCLMQNFYPRWDVFVDNKKAEIEICNATFMGVRVPSGNHLISFRYEATDLKRAFWISLLLLFCIGSACIIKLIRSSIMQRSQNIY